jgi:uncharacterized protein involved in type VI secretion and phage assembly
MFNPLGKEKLLLGQWVDVELDLADGGQHYFNDFELHLIHDYRIREYTVQFSETDFAFINRLTEEEGIYYFFKHSAGMHTKVELPMQAIVNNGDGHRSA